MMKYDLNYVDEKSKRYYFIKELIIQYKYKAGFPNREIPYRES